jgi:hypothetical protein
LTFKLKKKIQQKIINGLFGGLLNEIEFSWKFPFKKTLTLPTEKIEIWGIRTHFKTKFQHLTLHCQSDNSKNLLQTVSNISQ